MGKYIDGYYYTNKRLAKRRAARARYMRSRYVYTDHNPPNGARDQLVEAIDKLIESADTMRDDTQDD